MDAAAPRRMKCEPLLPSTPVDSSNPPSFEEDDAPTHRMIKAMPDDDGAEDEALETTQVERLTNAIVSERRNA